MPQGYRSITAGSIESSSAGVPVRCRYCVSRSGAGRKWAMLRSSPIAPRVWNVTRRSGCICSHRRVCAGSWTSLCGSPAHPKVSCKRAWEMSQPVKQPVQTGWTHSGWLNFGIKPCALTSHHLAWLSGPFASLTSKASCRKAVLACAGRWDVFCQGTRSECWTQGTKQPGSWLALLCVCLL